MKYTTPWQSKVKTCELDCDPYASIGRLFQMLPVYAVAPHQGQAKAKHNKDKYRE